MYGEDRGGLIVDCRFSDLAIWRFYDFRLKVVFEPVQDFFTGDHDCTHLAMLAGEKRIGISFKSLSSFIPCRIPAFDIAVLNIGG